MHQTHEKEKYEVLEMEVIVFESGDIITASGDTPLDPLNPPVNN